MGSQKKKNQEGSNALLKRKSKVDPINPSDSSFWFWTWILTVFLFALTLWTLILRPDLLERLRHEVLHVRLKNVPAQTGLPENVQQEF